MPTRFDQQNIEASRLKVKISAVNIGQSGNSFYMAIFVTPRNNDIMRVEIGGITILEDEDYSANSDNKAITLPGGTNHIINDVGGDERKKEYEIRFELLRNDFESLLGSKKVRMGIKADDGSVAMGTYQVKVMND